MVRMELAKNVKESKGQVAHKIKGLFKRLQYCKSDIKVHPLANMVAV